MSTSIKQIQKKIERIKTELSTLGPMRPGSISKQYRNPKEKKTPYYQISYTYRMKSHTEYVRPENLATLREETITYKRFRVLIQQWTDLALKISQMQTRQSKRSG